MPASTPISPTKTAALSRISDGASKGYCRYVCGVVSKEKAKAMIQKLHERHQIGATPARRAVRKAEGRANAILAVYWPTEATTVEWMMVFTSGTLDSPEPQLHQVAAKPRPRWLGYELVQRSGGGAAGNRAAWTWRRPAEEMQEHYTLLKELSAKRYWTAVGEHLKRVANQPGFHGVREQSKRLFDEARSRGYAGELPQLYYVQKVAHGEAHPLVERTARRS